MSPGPAVCSSHIIPFLFLNPMFLPQWASKCFSLFHDLFSLCVYTSAWNTFPFLPLGWLSVFIMLLSDLSSKVSSSQRTSISLDENTSSCPFFPVQSLYLLYLCVCIHLWAVTSLRREVAVSHIPVSPSLGCCPRYRGKDGYVLSK